jgi:hypothetical protein
MLSHIKLQSKAKEGKRIMPHKTGEKVGQLNVPVAFTRAVKYGRARWTLDTVWML